MARVWVWVAVSAVCLGERGILRARIVCAHRGLFLACGSRLERVVG